MIVEALLTFLAALVDVITSLIPSGAPPSWFADVAAQVGNVWSYGAGLGAWFPWSLAGTVIPTVFAAMGIGFGIRLVRIVASFFTGGGGSSA